MIWRIRVFSLSIFLSRSVFNQLEKDIAFEILVSYLSCIITII